MAIKDLLKKGENKIKAIVYVDELNNVKVEYKDFNTIITSYDNDDIVKIKNPNKKDFEWLQDILIDNVLVSKDKKQLQAEFDEVITYKLIDKFTTLGLNLDLEKEEELEEWREILEESSGLILAIRREISDIITFVMKSVVKNIQEFMELPTDFKEAILNEKDNKKLVAQVEKIKSDMANKQKDITELEGEINV